METETRKLLGTFDGATVDAHDVDVAASCNRVPTIDGHLENAWVETSEALAADDAMAAMREAHSLALHSSPDQFIEVFEDANRPQPRLDRMVGEGMSVAAGGVRETSDGVQYNCLAHNTLRGAAGASVLNGELLVEEGWI
jgi:aspartate-semialdehyde dehydrogenase